MKNKIARNVDLLKVAYKAGHLAFQASRDRDSEIKRLTQRILMDEDIEDPTAWADAILLLAKDREGTKSFLLLQAAILLSADHLWETLWNEKHPDRYGQAWAEGAEDFDLMKVWRQKAQAMIKDCHQEAVLDMTYDDYVAKLIGAGADKEVLEDLTDLLSEVMYEG